MEWDFLLGLVLTGTLFGAMGFFSFVIAPLTFGLLPQEHAGAFVRGLFPWYYLVSIVLASLAGLALITTRPMEGGILLTIAVGAVISRQVLMPRINAHRDAAKAGDAAAEKIFDRLHKVTVWINIAQLLALIVAMVLLVVA